MRLLVAAAAALALAAPALSVNAAPSQPGASRVQPAVLTFRDATSRFEREMARMGLEMSHARSVNETRAIAAKYQPEADALADLIDARLAAEGNVGGRYRDAEKVREFPDDIRRQVDRERLAVRRGPGVRPFPGAPGNPVPAVERQF